MHPNPLTKSNGYEFALVSDLVTVSGDELAKHINVQIYRQTTLRVQIVSSLT